MKKILVVYSGGLDSYTLLKKAIIENNVVQAVTFNYGQKHAIEISYAESVCKELNIKHEVIRLNLKDILSQSSLVGNSEIPEGNYDKEKMKLTVVPNRNMVMISVAASLAIRDKLDHLWYAAHSGDHEVYPDCRPEFIAKMAEVISICDYHKINFEAPFMNYTKADIVTEGLRMNVDFSKTWTCYVGGEKPCLKCSSCIERASAFKSNKAKDPLNEI